MLSSTCTLFVVAQWTSHLREWQPSLSGADVVTIITVLDIGAFTAFIPGTVYDMVGCKIVGFVGALLSFVGYVGMYLLLQFEQGASVGGLCFFAFIIGQGSIWLVISSLNSVTGNFQRQDRGRAVGLLMTTFGLAAGIFCSLIMLYEGASTGPSVLLFVGTSMAVISAICTLGITKVSQSQLLTAKTGKTTQMLVMCVAALALITFRAVYHPVVNGVHIIELFIASLYVLVVLAQLRLVGRLVLRKGWRALFSESVADGIEASSLSGIAPSPASAAELEGVTFGVALRSLDYWLLLFVTFAAIGVGQNLCNSIADISGVNTASGVAIFAVGNSLGRFIPGYLSDMLFSVLDRISFILMCTMVLVISQVVLFVSDDRTPGVYIGILLTAAAFGSYWVLVPAIESEWFGRLHFGKIHGFLLFVAGDGGVVVFYQGLHGLAERWRGPCDEPGRVDLCFELKWLVCLIVSGIALLAASAMKVRQVRQRNRAGSRSSDGMVALRLACAPGCDTRSGLSTNARVDS